MTPELNRNSSKMKIFDHSLAECGWISLRRKWKDFNFLWRYLHAGARVSMNHSMEVERAMSMETVLPLHLEIPWSVLNERLSGMSFHWAW